MRWRVDCTKRAYPSITDAQREIRRLRKNRVFHKDRGVHTWRCPNCRSWHIGHDRAA